ncbi:MAG: polysaccharide biosynthesis tyrosine autokinase [Gemmatimonadaceae bacterium]
MTVPRDDTVETFAPTEGDEPGRGVTAGDIVAALRRRWYIALAVTAGVGAIGAWRTAHQPSVYEATASVRFRPEQSPITGVQTGTSRADYRVDPMVSEQQLIRTHNVAERVIQQLGLRLDIVSPTDLKRSELFGDVPPVVDSLAPPWDYVLTLLPDRYELSSAATRYGSVPYGDSIRAPGVTLRVPRRPPAARGDRVLLTLRSRERAIERVQGMLATRALPQTDIILISASSTDPSVARDVANATARAYGEFSSETQRLAARKKTEFIERSVADQRGRLTEAQNAVQRFKEGHQTLDVTADQKALFEQVRHLEETRRAAIVEENVYEKLLGKLSVTDTLDEDLRKLAATDALAKQKSISDLYTRWLDLIKERSLLKARGFNDNYDDVKALTRQIEQIKSDLRRASQLYIEGINSRVSTYDKNIADLKRQSGAFPPLQSEQDRLEADVKSAQRTYDDLQMQLQNARIAESIDAGSVRPIDQAALPDFAVSPKRRQAVLFALALGLALGVGLAVLIERLDTSIRSPDELQDRFGLAVLGVIPAIRTVDAGDRSAGPFGNRLVAHADPRSPVAESYRSLRTNLAFARADRSVQAIVLTSPGPSDGKSTTVVNLAITFAQQGQRTLVVDADLRRAVLDKTLGVQRSPGLTEVIIGSVPLDQAVQRTNVDNLFVLTSGQFPPNPSELLGSPAARRVVDDARKQFDIILFDSPPLLAVTDAVVLSTMVDGTIVVVRTGQSARDAVRRAVSQLRVVKARVLGAVLNDVDFSRLSYSGSYGYYYYQYAYGAEPNQNGRRGMLNRLMHLTGPRGGGGDR